MGLAHDKRSPGGGRGGNSRMRRSAVRRETIATQSPLRFAELPWLFCSFIDTHRGPRGTSCNDPHIADEKTEVADCQETCHPRDFPKGNKTEHQAWRLCLMRPSRISPSEKSRKTLLADLHQAHRGLVVPGLFLHVWGRRSLQSPNPAAWGDPAGKCRQGKNESPPSCFWFPC